MTTKNFKVKNGIDIGNVADVIKVSGGVIQTKGGNIQVGITGANEIDTSSGNLTIDSAGGTVTVDDNLTVSGTIQYGSLSDGTITITAFVDEDNMASNSATLVPTQQSVKAYVDGEISTLSSGNVATATEATNVTVTANNTANETVYITFVDGATGTQGIETDTGLSYNPSTNVLSTTASAAQYSDLAERFAADTTYEPGTVVALGGAEEITATQEERSEKVFGVISRLGQAGYMMNAGAGTDATHPLIALAGRVQVKVIGPVSKGDRLVTSLVSGVARRAEADECTAFNVIGRALENKHTDGLGEVLCFVTAKS